MSAAALDPRLNAYRPDLAAARLRGSVEAERYAEGRKRQVRAASAPLRRAPHPDAQLDSEALHGEVVTVYDESGDWAWCQLEGDGYVGYLPAEALDAHVITATHRVTALRSYLFQEPDKKAPALALLSLNAALAVSGSAGGFVELATGGFVSARHVAPMEEVASDFVTVAERFLGTPYLWGGRTSLGLDCSALVQLSLQAAGIEAPRDCDMLRSAPGTAKDPEDLAALRRGDLLFWRGHIAVMLDGQRVIHANAHHMETAIEPLAEVLARVALDHAPLTAVKRPYAAVAR